MSALVALNAIMEAIVQQPRCNNGVVSGKNVLTKLIKGLAFISRCVSLVFVLTHQSTCQMFVLTHQQMCQFSVCAN